MTQRVKRQYTTEFKLESAKLADSIDPMEASHRLNVSESNLTRWLRAYRQGKLIQGAVQLKPKAPSLADLQAENKRLQAENNNLKQDVDILKKAAAYFVKGSR